MMHLYKKNYVFPVILLACMTLVQSCDNELDYVNTAAISPENVWTDEKLISAFLSDIHGGLMPGWPYNANESDEGMDGPGSMGNYLRGIISVASTGRDLSYGYIDKINFFINRVSNVPAGVLSEEKKNQLIGQAKFWRAWDYFGKVSVFGGVPLILEPQDISNKEGLFVPRNKTSECITQIIADLDQAIATLPDQWDEANYGRIDKGAAMALKGKVLLWYASPLFNTTNDQARWQAAYDANKTAVDFLKAHGKGLLEAYGQIWKQERNKELVMVNQFYYPDHAFNQAAIRPQPLTQGAANANQPTFALLNAFPKKDGSAMQFDVAKLNSDPAYNEQFIADFVANRDDRFNATVFTGGTPYPSPDLPAGTKYWSAWRKVADPTFPGGFKYVSLAAEQTGVVIGGGVSGFFDIKGLDNSLTKTVVDNASTDWVEIRFAEVLMSFGEAANEIGKTSEALQVLYEIRRRAGILPGSGNYGITATTQQAIREAYMNERYVEFAFENKRWGDLRRWKRFDLVNKQQHRGGIYFVLKEGQTISWTDAISDPAVRRKFTAVYIDNLDGEAQYKYNLDLNHWFYPISQKNLDASSALKQNVEWGGTFNPLE